MLAVLMDPILPVFAIMALGYVLGRTGFTTDAEARALNRFAMTILLPVFVFALVAEAPLRDFSPAPLMIYLLAEGVVFALGYLLARRVFRRERDESFLLGFAAIFANNALYVLPIALLLYGPEGVLPVTAVVTLDCVVAFGLAMLVLQLLRDGRATPLSVVRAIVRIPILQGIMAGLAFSLTGLPLPDPLKTFADVTGSGAAPVALFAMGVVLSQTPLRPDSAVLSFSALKMVAFPALFWGLAVTLAPGEGGMQQYLLASAGPSGAMAFSMALLYGVRTQTIAQVIVLTSVLTLVSLSLLA